MRLHELAGQLNALVEQGHGDVRVVDGFGLDVVEANGPVPPGTLGDPEDCNTVQLVGRVDLKLRREVAGGPA